MIQRQFPLGLHWQTQEPFLFCAHHRDHYPKGTSDFGPEKSLLTGRNLGQDFELGHGFRMYHGKVVPGFPVHPHRGFETITIVRQGYVDHADSLGAAGRYGPGDIQWMTAGSGVQHSEMFPLLNKDGGNTTELFQIWLNLPARNKMAAPHFKMLWREEVPVLTLDGGKVRVTLVAGSYNGVQPLSPPPASWASEVSSDTVIWLIRLESGGQLEIPSTNSGAARALYLFEGDSVAAGGETLRAQTGYAVDSSRAIALKAANTAAEILLLQSRPIGEPISQYGPFVMNSESEIRQTIADFRKTKFGGWPWPREDMVHGSQIERFAKYPDGRIERPST